MSYQKQKLLTICDQRGSSPIFLGIRVSHFVCFELCFCALLVFLLCFVCPMLPVSFHCPFLIATFFSIVYLALQVGIVAWTDVSGVRHYHVNDWWISFNADKCMTHDHVYTNWYEINCYYYFLTSNNKTTI